VRIGPVIIPVPTTGPQLPDPAGHPGEFPVVKPDGTGYELARLTGISRQTLYNEFGSRHDFAQAYVLREVEGFLLSVDGAVRAHPDEPRRALASICLHNGGYQAAPACRRRHQIIRRGKKKPC
ncbi:MAG: TetR/AcrR family transcriptional regulator, partial [Pseudomonadota bacterium]